MPSKAIAIRLSQKHGGVDELSKLSALFQYLRQYLEYHSRFYANFGNLIKSSIFKFSNHKIIESLNFESLNP
ncbi:MAG: hypothetical protein CVT94_06975 [Bacteroidetes bacterium HGW-Bacteroidetes-11]|jgi:hypothetical protein|nr:MAG: hypothetical protein CVT94_06975 [Bacteroidetes bacterium HGW-Bacteroidetes-11]